MQLEVILPLIAYLLVVFALSIYAMRKRTTGSFLNEYFLGRYLYQRQFVYRRPRRGL